MHFIQVHPLAQPVFPTSISDQGSLLNTIISACLKQLNDAETYQKSIVALAQRHSELGFLANEYCVLGDVLFYTLRVCLNCTVFNNVSELSWIRAYSSFLRAILPVTVFLQDCNENKKQRETRWAIITRKGCRIPWVITSQSSGEAALSRDVRMKVHQPHLTEQLDTMSCERDV